MKFRINRINNGWVLSVEGSIKGDDGNHCFKASEEFQLLEFIGYLMLGFRVKMERR